LSAAARFLFFFLCARSPAALSSLSLHDALPISLLAADQAGRADLLRQSSSSDLEPAIAALGHRHEQAAAEVLAQVESAVDDRTRSEEHTSELQSRVDLVCRLLLEKKNSTNTATM